VGGKPPIVAVESLFCQQSLAIHFRIVSTTTIGCKSRARYNRGAKLVRIRSSTPDHEFLFATDLGEDRVYAYRCEPGSQAFPLRSAEPPFTAVTAGARPRHMAFGSDGRFVYLIEEMGEAIVVFERDGARLNSIQTVRLADKEWPGDTGAAALHLSPDGKFLYASNRANANDLVIYSVDPKSGTLIPVGHQSSLGVKPRDFCIYPTEKFLVVANQDSDNLVIFKRDLEAGTLTTDKTVEVGSPVCVQVVPVPEQ
jgi:6-phosphogluconolactonase